MRLPSASPCAMVVAPALLLGVFVIRSRAFLVPVIPGAMQSGGVVLETVRGLELSSSAWRCTDSRYDTVGGVLSGERPQHPVREGDHTAPCGTRGDLNRNEFSTQHDSLTAELPSSSSMV